MECERFLELVELFRNEAADDSQIAELTTMLRCDARLRREFVQEMLLEGCLLESAAPVGAARLRITEDYDSFSDVFSGRVVFRAIGGPRPRSRRTWTIAAAAAALAVGAALLVAPLRTSEGPKAELLSGQIESARPGDPRTVLSEEFRVVGPTSAVVKPAGGALLELSPGSIASLTPSGDGRPVALTLKAGSVEVQASAAAGVKVVTVDLSALGVDAAFSVALEESATARPRTRVAVQSGIVRVTLADGVRTMEAGESTVFGN